jgi:hypothetical protein
MTDNKVRLSQVVGVYGPGAMLDLPDRSVLVMGLDRWDMTGKNTFKLIEEPRLQRLLYTRLANADDRRLVGDQPPEFRTPPIDAGDPKRPSPAIKATVFPRWFVCDPADGDPPNRRRLARFQDLEAPKRQVFRGDGGKPRRTSPIRFVCGCENGHLQDIDWRWVVHQNARGEAGAGAKHCAREMWQEESGVSADPRDTKITCDCGASLSLEELFQPKRLGPCLGERPWIGDRDPIPCTTPYLRLLTRSATNTYFAQVVRVISLPQAIDELARRVETVWSILFDCKTVADIQGARKWNPAVKANLESYSDGDVLAAVLSYSTAQSTTDAVEDPKVAEFKVLASGKALIGENSASANLHAETLDRSEWDPDGDRLLSGIESIVAVHRLREVSCLYGFTRFEPAPLAAEDLEDVGLAVRGAALAESPSWLPAVEQFGEGIFLKFSPQALTAWLARPSVMDRARQLQAGVDAWAEAKNRRGQVVNPNSLRERERPEYIMVHSLSHALMTEVAIDCGYPASALKERVYVMPRAPGEPLQCGLLIYTATAGNQGTLGGLVEVTNRFARVLASALERERLCSGDPVCADHDPERADEDRMLHGASCHGCLLISETSCEARNVHLDRALLVDTVGPNGAAFF